MAIYMFCEKCGTQMREGARFCPACGLTAGSLTPPTDEYSYETVQKLYPMKAAIPIFIIWLVFTGIGVLAAMGSGFWYVGAIISGTVLFAILIVTWANKGKSKKWGADRTLWILTPEGYGSGHPPDVAKRIGGIGAAGAAVTFAGRQNWAVTSQGIHMAKQLKYVKGLPIMPWEVFISAEYRPEKLEIALHLPNGQVGLIHTNPDNYAYVEQLVRLYMGGK